MRTAIAHAEERELFPGPNPASNINVGAYAKKVDKSLIPDKRPFRIVELNNLFLHPWFTGCKSLTETHQTGNYRLDSSEYWVPILALFTGCRAAELGGLRVAEIRLNDAHPHIIIRDNKYRGVKNDQTRLVPVLDALITTGFSSYVTKIIETGADRLFPDWIPRNGVNFKKDEAAWSNAKLIRAFNRTVIPNTIRDSLVEGGRQELTFHCFRGTFKTMLSGDRFKLNPNIIHEVVGHSKSELDRRYMGTIPIEETYRAIRSCNYSGIILPPAP